MRPLALPWLIGLAVPACGPVERVPVAARSAPDPALDEMLGLMRRRLDVMHDVARSKWATQAPIDDPAREAALLREVAGRGEALGLEPAFTRAFFRGQIAAAKLVQRADFRRWVADGGPRGQAPDLAGVLRPRIDELNRALLAALAGARPRLADVGPAALRARAERVLAGAGIDAEVRAAAIAPLVVTPD
jgi:chorismate mutase